MLISTAVKMTRLRWLQVFACVACIATSASLGSDVEALRGHRVVRAMPSTEQQLDVLTRLLMDDPTIDFWHFPSVVNQTVDVRLTQSQYDDVMEKFHQTGIQTTTLIHDVQRLIDMEKASRTRPSSGRKVSDFQYDKYHTLDEIVAWMQNITNVYKDRASLFNVTTSYEGRPLMGIKISTGVFKKPAFWIEGGIHAREWISPATVIYMAGQMLDQYKVDPTITEMVDKYDWYILPVTNPDGYVYTWTNDKARLWRKTRSKQAGNCIGVDPNRNWDVQWCKNGASKDPCADTYCGPKAFSEVEVKGVADYIKGINNVTGFIDFHSYSQLWMSPYGYSRNLPKDFTKQDKGSQIAVDALQKIYGTKYKHGSIARTIYLSSGSSADWTYDGAGVTFSYGVELRDTGKYGFLLPADQILPSGKETLVALAALAEYIYGA